MARLDFDVSTETMDPLLRMLLDIGQTNPKEEEVWAYINEVYRRLSANGHPPNVTPEHFYVQGDIATWQELFDAREGKHPPPAFDALQLTTALGEPLTPFVCPKTAQMIVTFRDRLERARQLQEMWSQQNESKADRRARLNREAQKRYRKRVKAIDGPNAEHALAVTKAYAAYMEGCKKRKEVLEQWDAYINALRAEWQRIKSSGPA